MYGPYSDKKSYTDFIIKKEHHFLQNIFSKVELESSATICNLETYYEFFKKFIYVVTHLCVKSTKNSQIENVEDKQILDFMQNDCYDSFFELFERISEIKISSLANTKNKKKLEKTT